MKDKTRGEIYAFISAILLGFSFIFSKIILEKVNLETTATIWFFFAALIALVWNLANRQIHEVFHLKTNIWFLLGLLGLVNAAAALFWFYSIKDLGPSLTVFITRFEVLFVILLGVVFLKEKFYMSEWIGITVAVTGVLAISYTPGIALRAGIFIALLSALFASIASLLAKIVVKHLHASVLVLVRVFFCFIFLAFHAVIFNKLEPVPPSVLYALVLGPLFSGIFGFYFMFKAYNLIELSRATTIKTFEPVNVLILMMIFFKEIPTITHLTGGFLIIAGVVLLTKFEKVKKPIHILHEWWHKGAKKYHSKHLILHDKLVKHYNDRNNIRHTRQHTSGTESSAEIQGAQC